MVAVYKSGTLHQTHAYYAKDASKNWVALDHLADQSIALGRIGNASSPGVNILRELSTVSFERACVGMRKIERRLEQATNPTNIGNSFKLDLA